jgi:hypothetical protein
MFIDVRQANVGVEVEADVHERPPCNLLNFSIALREGCQKRCPRLRRLTVHTAPYPTPRLASLFLVIRSPDILIFMRMTSDLATCRCYTGIDPFAGEEVYTAQKLRDRKLQRALLQFFKPANHFEVREALLKSGRSDLIGCCCDCLIPSSPPKAALEARMEKANRALTEGSYVHTIKNQDDTPTGKPAPKVAGYRPHRKTSRRRPRQDRIG